MRLQNKVTLLFLFYFVLIYFNIALCSPDSIATDVSVSRNILFGPDSIYFQKPNPILALFSYKPITNDTIAVEQPFDSLSITDTKGAFHVLILDSDKICISLEGQTKQNILPITFYSRGDILGIKIIHIKTAGNYGEWAYFILTAIFLAIFLLAFFRKKIFRKLSEKYKQQKIKYKLLFSNRHGDVEDTKLPSDNSINGINEKLTTLLQLIKFTHKKIVAEIQEIKLSHEQMSNYDKKIADKNLSIKKLEVDLENFQRQYNLSVDNYKRLEKSKIDEVKALNDTIMIINENKEKLETKLKQLELEFQQFRSRQSEMSANSLQISTIDKKKMERYRDTCKTIIKTIDDIPQIVLGQSFTNSNIMGLLNHIFLNQYLGSSDDLLKIINDIDNIITYQRTTNSLIMDKFSGALSIVFEEFDQKYRELIFDNCVSGKVDKMLIGFKTIYGIKYQIEMSNEDLSQFEKMCDRIKSLENELILNLKLGGFEPYSIILFEELNVQKASYIENIGGLSLKELFPYYEKKPGHRDLILEITQWAYKKDGGLWKNRKALVKISI